MVAVVDGKVAKMRYKVRGCPYTIATFSFIAEWCEGRTVAEVQALTRASLIQTLSLPSTKAHCAAFAEDTLKQLLENA